MQLSGLFIYPVKSLRGLSVQSAEVDALGLVGDRRFLVVDEAGKFLTQRAHARMALITTALSPDTLTIASAGMGSIAVPRSPDRRAPLRAVTVWNSANLQAEDCGDEASEWLSAFLGLRCRLVRIGEAFHRPVLKNGGDSSDVVSFADSVPFLVIGESSLDDLNSRLELAGERPVPMDRFRPNLVISGSAPFAEDSWPRLTIGAIRFRSTDGCSRCIMTTTDQLTAQRGKEPLRTLARYRRGGERSAEVFFGQNLIHENTTGVMRVGDEVRAS